MSFVAVAVRSQCDTRGQYLDISVSNGVGSVPKTDLGDEMGTLDCPNDCPAPSQGLFVTPFCGSEPPDPAVCVSTSAPVSDTQCLLGAPPDCIPCPQGGMCPGGYRVCGDSALHSPKVEWPRVWCPVLDLISACLRSDCCAY